MRLYLILWLILWVITITSLKSVCLFFFVFGFFSVFYLYISSFFVFSYYYLFYLLNLFLQSIQGVILKKERK